MRSDERLRGGPHNKELELTKPAFGASQLNSGVGRTLREHSVEGWDRPHYLPGGGDALVMYLVFGRFSGGIRCSRERHRTNGLPRGVEAWKKTRDKHLEWFTAWEQGHFGEQLAVSGLRDAVLASPEALVIQGTVTDPSDLLYLRDCVGVVTALSEDSGSAILDTQTLRWWSPLDWREGIFQPDVAQPLRHVIILWSEDAEGPGLWYHTRGMRKFGRPDISVPGVPPELRAAVIDLCERFIQMQALGAIVPDGQPIRIGALPEGMLCFTEGEFDDPDFNNRHLEIRWPEQWRGAAQQ